MITKKQRILLLLAAGYALALTGWTAGGTLRLERQSPAETEDFLRRGAQEQGTFALEDLAQDAPG